MGFTELLVSFGNIKLYLILYNIIIYALNSKYIIRIFELIFQDRGTRFLINNKFTFDFHSYRNDP